jgi:hypothetical protein
VASAALEAVAQHRLRGGVRVGAIYEASLRIGATINRMRRETHTRDDGAPARVAEAAAPEGPA